MSNSTYLESFLKTGRKFYLCANSASGKTFNKLELIHGYFQLLLKKLPSNYTNFIRLIEYYLRSNSSIVLQKRFPNYNLQWNPFWKFVPINLAFNVCCWATPNTQNQYFCKSNEYVDNVVEYCGRLIDSKGNKFNFRQNITLTNKRTPTIVGSLM